MSSLDTLIAKLRQGIKEKSSFIECVKYPRLLISSLRELNNMIGNESIKDSVADQINHMILIKKRIREGIKVKPDDNMINTVIYGPPGVGKTVISTKLAKIWYALGYLEKPKTKTSFFGAMATEDQNDVYTNPIIFLSFFIFFIFIILSMITSSWSFYNRYGMKASAIFGAITLVVILMFLMMMSLFYVDSVQENENMREEIAKQSEKSLVEEEEVYIPDSELVTVVSRADLIGQYVGWTAKKVNSVLTASLGKVLFIDEAYSIATDSNDIFGIEALTALNLFLSEHPGEIIVIMAGYQNLLEDGIFRFQPGLKRRFMWHFNCYGYNDKELYQIFKYQTRKKGWNLIEEEKIEALFRKYLDAFPNYGGDTERLVFLAELEHSKDYIGKKIDNINSLNANHVERGILKLKENTVNDHRNTSSNPLNDMMRMMNAYQNNHHRTAATVEEVAG